MKNQKKQKKIRVEEEPDQPVSPATNMLRIYCRLDRCENTQTIIIPPLDDSGKKIDPFDVSYEKGSELDLLISKFCSPVVELNKNSFYDQSDWSIPYLPLSLTEIKTLYNMTKVTESDLKELRESHDSFPDFCKQLETVAIAYELLRQ